MKIACFLINRCPSSANDFKTPMEKWSGQLAQYQSLKVFGCLAYAHTRQDKLDVNAIKYVFFFYPEGVKGYKLWNLEPIGPRYIISRDVVFNYEKMAKLDEV